MSGARFARSGRARFFICFVGLLLMLGMVAIFHNTTRQLDQTREKHLACEQQQETLNEQLQSIVEEKFTLQKNYKVELDEQMQTRQDLELKLKKLGDQLTKEQLETRMQYDKLQHSYKLLQNEYKEFVKECTRSKQQLLDEGSEINRKMKESHAKELQEQSVLSSELAMWQEKYNTIANEKGEAKNRLAHLEHILTEYETHCQYKPKAALAELLNNKPLDMSKIPLKSPTPQNVAPESSRRFNQQVRLTEGRYHINYFTKNTNNATNTTFTTTTTASGAIFFHNGVGGKLDIIPTEISALSFAQRTNGSLILNSVENFQIAPQMNKKLGGEILNKSTSTAASQVKGNRAISNLQVATNKTSRAAVSSTSHMPPLQFPPQKQQQPRKLPDNVAPIPEHFEDLLKNEEQPQQQQQQLPSMKESNTHGGNKDVVETQGDAAVAAKPKPHNEGDNNNRYLNVVKDMDGIASPKESKNNEAYINEQNFNVPNNDEDNNFFDAADDTKKNMGSANTINKAQNGIDDFLGNSDDGPPDAGDIEVKQNKHLLDADTNNVNNEVAGDQGKELDDGLHLEEGIEEDADEDEYPHLARQQGEEAIRN